MTTKTIDFVQINQSEKDNSGQETSDQEEDHDQEHHHLVEERNLTESSFDGTMDSSAGGQSAADADELVNLRMAALTVNQYLNFHSRLELLNNNYNIITGKKPVAGGAAEECPIADQNCRDGCKCRNNTFLRVYIMELRRGAITPYSVETGELILTS
jgi:hypothetical protein